MSESELLKRRAAIIAAARAAWDTAVAREGGPTPEDIAAFDRAFDEANRLGNIASGRLAIPPEHADSEWHIPF